MYKLDAMSQMFRGCFLADDPRSSQMGRANLLDSRMACRGPVSWVVRVSWCPLHSRMTAMLELVKLWERRVDRRCYWHRWLREARPSVPADLLAAPREE